MITVADSAEPGRQLDKTATGIAGLDEITGGGFPQGRPTLVCGGAGCGKTLLAIEFLVRGATRYGEPGVIMSFEESPNDLAANVRALGFDVPQLIADRQLVVDFVRIEPSEIDETGDYDLDGLFIRLGHAIDSIGAKRVALDTIEALFAGLTNPGILRAELRRLFRWLKDRGVTAVITAERGNAGLTRHGLEEYVSDCVILLDHRVTSQVSTRRLRIVKYRGSVHGTNEYPFLIDRQGITVLPITSLELDHSVSEERVSTGLPALDEMLDGTGVFRGSSVLITGGPGAGKTSLAAHFAHGSCRRGERCIFFSFEESPAQLIRNVKSIGIDLTEDVRAGRLRIVATRPSHLGLEAHLIALHREVDAFRPAMVVADPITGFDDAGPRSETREMLVRLVDMLKARQITCVLTTLSGPGPVLMSGADVSSITDTWILLRDRNDGIRARSLLVLKSRGMAHSNEARALVFGPRGLELADAGGQR
jgi:circadian clock protein KaiC